VANSGGRRRLAADFLPALEDLAARIGRGEARDLRKLVAAHFPESEGDTEGRQGGVAVEGFLRALEDFYAEGSNFRAWLRNRARPVLAALQRAAFSLASEEVEAETDLEGLEPFFAELTAAFSARYALSSLRSLEAAVETAPEAAGAAALATLKIWQEDRPARVARRESRGQANAAAKEAWRRSGVTRLVWRASGETCPFCTRLDGKIVAISGGSFVAAGEEWEAEGRRPLKPRAKITHPPLHRGCDCQISPAG